MSVETSTQPFTSLKHSIDSVESSNRSKNCNSAMILTLQVATSIILCVGSVLISYGIFKGKIFENASLIFKISLITSVWILTIAILLLNIFLYIVVFRNINKEKTRISSLRNDAMRLEESKDDLQVEIGELKEQIGAVKEEYEQNFQEEKRALEAQMKADQKREISAWKRGYLASRVTILNRRILKNEMNFQEEKRELQELLKSANQRNEILEKANRVLKQSHVELKRQILEKTQRIAQLKKRSRDYEEQIRESIRRKMKPFLDVISSARGQNTTLEDLESEEKMLQIQEEIKKNIGNEETDRARIVLGRLSSSRSREVQSQIDKLKKEKEELSLEILRLKRENGQLKKDLRYYQDEYGYESE